MDAGRVIGRLVGVDNAHGVSRFSFISDRFRRYEQTWVSQHRLISWLIVTGAFLSTCFWLYWLIRYLLVRANIELGIALVIVQTYALIALLLSAVYRYYGRNRVEPIADRPLIWPSVDVFICTYDEDRSVLLPTLISALALEGEHRVYLLDDGRREEIRELACEVGVGYLTRPTNEHAKAGNINHALEVTNGDLILILDADHVVMSDMLTDLVGHFDDPSICLVQTPHEFANTDSIQHYSADRHEQSLFFRVLMPSKDEMGAAFWCGSAAILRRSALESVGGVAVETIAEDYHTSIKMISRGWRTRYVNRTYVLGMAPGDIQSYLIQRDRWARGNLSVLRSRENPLIAHGLTLKQRMAFAESLFAYGSGPMRMLILLVLVGTLWSGRIPISASLPVLAGIWLPSFLLSEIAFAIMAQGYSLNPEFLHFETLTMEIFTKAWKAALFAKTDRSFKVTPKTAGDNGGWAALRPLRWTIALFLALIGGLVVQWCGFAPRLPGIAIYLVSILAIIEVRRLLRSLVLVAKRRQHRSAYRVEAPGYHCIGYTPTHTGYIVGTTLDLSQIGVGIRLVQAHNVDIGDRLVIGVDFGYGTARFYTEVRSKRGDFIGLVVLDAPDEDVMTMIRSVYVDSNMSRLRGRSQYVKKGERFKELAKTT
jgi:cellulose synthase (UDP-forming)